MDDIDAAMDCEVYETSEVTQYTAAQVISFNDYDCAEKRAN